MNNNVLIERILKGEIELFRHLIDEYKDRSFTLALSIVKNELLAEEAVQDAFINVYNALNAYKGESKFSTWLYKIVVNESLRKIRNKKIKFTQIDAISASDYTYETSNQSVNLLKEEEQRKYIAEVLGKLPENESLVLKLFYLNENSLAEMEEITGFSQSNCKVLLHRARKNFHTHLSNLLKHEIKSIL